MESPLISIITASYNYEQYIRATIESVLNQIYTNWELIVVDDGSKDNSVEIIKEYCVKDNRIKLFQHENGINKGLAETIQLGIKNSKSDWIAFLEADDTITPDYLEKKINIINKYSSVNYIFNNTNIIANDKGTIEWYKKYLNILDDFLNKMEFPCKLIKILKNKHVNNYIQTFSIIMMKKDLFDNIDYNSPVKPWLDYYIWMQISQKTNCYYINEKLTNWLRHENSYITKSIPDKSILLFRIKQFRYLGFYPPLLPVIFKSLRKCIIKFSLKRKELVLFGKEIKF